MLREQKKGSIMAMQLVEIQPKELKFTCFTLLFLSETLLICISYGQNSGRVSMHSTEDNEGTNCGTVSEVNVEETTNDASSASPLVAVIQRWPVYRNRSTIPTRFAG
ncbi:hypothetical protein LINPERHAP2_LOCUS42299 [Linum perenne]